MRRDYVKQMERGQEDNQSAQVKILHSLPKKHFSTIIYLNSVAFRTKTVGLIHCDRVDVPPSGTVVYANERGIIEGDRPYFSMGTFAELRCDNNTVLSGEGFLTCTESGTWDFSMPKCVGIMTTQAPTPSTEKTTGAIVAITTTAISSTRTTKSKARTTKKPTMRTTTTTKKPVKSTTITKMTTKSTTTAKTSTTTTTTLRNVMTAMTEPPVLLREKNTEPDQTFWQNWKNLLYLGCDSTNSNRSPFCNQVKNPNEYENLIFFEIPETAEYQHMDTKLLRYLTNALQSEAIRSSLNIGNLLHLVLYGDRNPDPPVKMTKTMEKSIRIVLCLYIDTIILDKNIKPDAKISDSDDVTQKLKNSLWQVVSFAYRNYKKQQTETIQATMEVPTSISSRNHQSTTIPIKDIEFANMETYTIRRDERLETASVAFITATTTPTPALAQTPNPKTCELQTLTAPPNSSLIKIVSCNGTTTSNDFTNITRASIDCKLYFQCDEGYEMIGSVNVAECKENSTWSNLLFQCKGNFNI